MEAVTTTSISEDDDPDPRWTITVVPRDANVLAQRSGALALRESIRAAVGRIAPLQRSWTRPPGFSVTSDRLDAPIAEVADLIAAYRPVGIDRRS